LNQLKWLKLTHRKNKINKQMRLLIEKERKFQKGARKENWRKRGEA
jgi:hypothetical protein